nr:hypothetical protein [Tanacetum cinerariifolium]
ANTSNNGVARLAADGRRIAARAKCEAHNYERNHFCQSSCRQKILPVATIYPATCRRHQLTLRSASSSSLLISSLMWQVKKIVSVIENGGGGVAMKDKENGNNSDDEEEII